MKPRQGMEAPKSEETWLVGSWKTDTSEIVTYRVKGSPYIYCAFTLNGKRYRKTTKQTDPYNAMSAAQRFYYDVESGKGLDKDLSFVKCANIYLENRKSSWKSTATYRTYKGCIANLCEYFSKTTIDKISNPEIDSYITWRLDYYNRNPTRQIKRGKEKYYKTFSKVSEATINKEVMILRSILKYWRAKYGPTIVKEIDRQHKLYERTKTEVLSDEDLQRVKDYLYTKNPLYVDVIEFTVSTGCRIPSELAKLKWKHVDFKKRTILFADRKSKSTQQIDTLLPMPQNIHDMLQRLKKRPEVSTKPEDAVFVLDNGRPVGKINKAWNKALKALGLYKPELTPYTLRHKWCKKMITEHPEIRTYLISRAMGHSSSSMVEKRYGVLAEGKLLEVFRGAESRELQVKALEEKIRKDGLESVLSNGDLESLLEALKCKI